MLTKLKKIHSPANDWSQRSQVQRKRSSQATMERLDRQVLGFREEVSSPGRKYFFRAGDPERK